MLKSLKARLIVTGLITVFVIGVPTAMSTPLLTAADWGDLLARTHMKPLGVGYVGCRYLPERQGKPLQAAYSVAGKDAPHVEAYLIRTASGSLFPE